MNIKFSWLCKYFKHRVLRFTQKQKITDFLDRLLLGRKKICIISNNCWNIGIYKNLNRPYNTPFIGLAIDSSDFIKMLRNLDYYLAINLSENDFIHEFDFPVARIDGDIEIKFIHYKNVDEAISKWNKRKMRLVNFINQNGMDSVIVKCCDSDSKNENNYTDFASLKINRCLYLKNNGSILNDRKGAFPSGPELYKARLLYYKKFLTLFKGL